MRKYWALARAELLDAIQEKEEIFIWIIIEAIPVFVMGSLWLANQKSLVRVSISEMVTYYLVVMVTARLTEFYFDEYVQEDIRDGTFARYLIKPIRSPELFIPVTWGRKLFANLILLPIIALMIIGFRQYLVFPDLAGVLLFAAFLFISSFIRYSLSVLVTTGAFYWEQTHSLVHLRWILETVAGGYVLPLIFYPDWLRFIPDSLPFKYIYFVPTAVFTGMITNSEAANNLLPAFLWMIGLLVISHLAWRIGVKRYISVGG
ncbi:ABC-2 family transporter protein [Candidatus Collierbacteria bacterium]|nr:ABC-2 family transporter protein [Candidatus Collierbacteria bacterium]